MIANTLKKPQEGILSDADSLLSMPACIQPDNKYFLEKLSRHQLSLIKGIGVLAWGNTFEEIIDKVEIINRLCEIFLKNK